MIYSDDLIVIDYKKLAQRLAEEEFTREMEPKYKFNEIYEQVDETGKFFMRMEFQSILEAMEAEWKEILQEFDITNSIY